MFSSKVELNASNPAHKIEEYLNWFIPEKHYKEKEKRILYLIKSCEFYDLNEKESIQSINKVLGKESMSRRTYYNYKKKLYDNQIFEQLKGSYYDTYGVKLLLLDRIFDDLEKTRISNILIGQQFPKRKQVLEDEESHKVELNKVMHEIGGKIERFKDLIVSQSSIDSLLFSDHVIKEEFVNCGKDNCNRCPHGPYYYTWWNDANNKTRKKYLGA